MARMLTVCAVLVTWPLLVRADDPPKPTETVIRINASPMAAPKPALRYSLLPELRDMTPGNPIQGYLKCFMEQQNFFHHKESVENREKWQTMPLKDLPDLRHYGGSALKRADDAARMETPDWQILLEMKRDGINTLLPEVQQLRMLAAALKVRFRGQVAAHRFDDGIRSAQTMFAMSRHLGEHPTIIANLVGIAIAHLCITPIDEMIDQPNCPNLYWALTQLPAPLLSTHRGVQGERFLLTNELALIDDKAVMSQAKLDQAIEFSKKLQGLVGPNRHQIKEEAPVWIKKRADDAATIDKARARLVEQGLDKNLVAKFPATQVVLLDERLAYESQRDDELKWMTFPAWKAEEEFKAAVKHDREMLYGGLLVAVPKVRRAQGRLEQRIAMLRVVEALRLHAAAHQGQLPEKLSDIKAVPIPEDPFTGKTFIYKLEGKTATLRGTPPPGEENNAGYNLRYEVTIRN